jgi:hypothetical protein
MKPPLVILTLVLAVGAALSQPAPWSGSAGEPQWQKVDQLCGQLELATPTKKTIVVNGKREERSYVTYVHDAEVSLYRGTHSDKECCGSEKPVAQTHSKRFGAFELLGLQHGLYWLQVKKGTLNGEIPLLVTDDFNARTCRAPEVGRSFVVNSKPPATRVRIR